MKTNFALGLIAAVAVSAVSTAIPAMADHEERAQADAAAAGQERHEARKQEHKAQRDAARGDIAGAERHQAEAQEASHEAHHDAHQARKQAEKAGY